MKRSHALILMLAPALIWIVTLAATVEGAGNTGAIPQRGEIDPQYQWRVEDIYANQDAWEADFKRVEASIPAFDQYRGHLGDSPEMLLNCLKLSDSLSIIINDLYVFAYLKLDEDTRVSLYQELGGRANSLSSRLNEAAAFIEPEILALDPSKLEGFLARTPQLQVYRFYLEDQMRRKAHILSPEGEELLALAGPLTGAPIQVFNMIDNADHKLGSMVDGKGDTIELTYGRYSRILKGTDRELRRIANDTVQNSWKEYINTLATTLGMSLDKDLFLTKARKYPSTLERSLDNNNIPVAVYHSLVDAVDQNLSIVHRLTALRKKVLGYDTLYSYDMTVPLAPEYEKQFSYEETRDVILKGLSPLGKQYLKDVEMGLNSGWVDVFENEGKATGGYNWGTYRSHPYILMNFDSTIHIVFTLAHEMGHALHGYYTNRNQPYIYHGLSLFTAEVASTCNEAILMQYLLKNAASKEEKIMLLNQYITQIEGTFISQVMFAEYELMIHDQVQKGGAVSVDFFRKTYRDIFQKYYGPELVIGPDNDMGALKLYHFYRTFYVYQYATSYAAAQMLSQKILAGDKKAVDAYLKFLGTGSSKYPMEILKDAGVDMASPEPVQWTLKLFSELIDEMERLLAEK